MMSLVQTANRVTRLATLAFALAVSGPAAFAQQPTAAATATAGELVKVTGSTLLFESLIPGVIEQAKNLFLQQNPNLAKDLNEVAAKMRSDMAARQAELNNEVIRLYASSFTEQELKEILAFYSSASGKKLLAVQPAVVDGSMKFAQTWANKLSEEVLAKMREEMKKKGHAL
ncbi:MAG: DUF2059 domain-containing protein [Pseudolabrys sp.]